MSIRSYYRTLFTLPSADPSAIICRRSIGIVALCERQAIFESKDSHKLLCDERVRIQNKLTSRVLLLIEENKKKTK